MTDDTTPPKPPAKSTAQRQAEYAARHREQGLVRVPTLWAHPDDHAAIKTFAVKLTAKRGKKGA